MVARVDNLCHVWRAHTSGQQCRRCGWARSCSVGTLLPRQDGKRCGGRTRSDLKAVIEGSHSRDRRWDRPLQRRTPVRGFWFWLWCQLGAHGLNPWLGVSGIGVLWDCMTKDWNFLHGLACTLLEFGILDVTFVLILQSHTTLEPKNLHEQQSKDANFTSQGHTRNLLKVSSPSQATLLTKRSPWA